MSRLLILVATALCTQVWAATDYRSMVLGQWQCQTTVETEFGSTIVVGMTQLEDNGRFISDGNLVLSHPSLATEILLSFNSNGQWLFENNTVVGQEIDGSINSDSPFLTSLATSMQQQIGTDSTFKAKLKRIGSQTMMLLAENDTQIRCIRPTKKQ